MVRSFFALFLTFFLVASARAELKIDNLNEDETLRYPIALLRGKASEGKHLRIRNLDNPRPDGSNQVDVVDGQFKVLVELATGKNRLELQAGELRRQVTVHYKPMTTRYKVNVVYVTAQDEGTRYITTARRGSSELQGPA